MKGKTASGFKYEFDETRLQDWDFMEIMADAESEDEGKKITASRELVNFIFGPNKKAFIEHIKKANGGRATTAAVFKEVTGVISTVRALKK